MINLLPPQEKKELSRSRSKKLVIVLSNVALIGLLSLALILFSLKFYILSEVDISKLNLENTQKRYQTPTLLTLKQVVSQSNATLVKVDDFYQNETHFGDVLKIVFGIERPEGISLTDINITRESGKIKVIASGKADTRDHLLVFRDSAQKNQNTENVNFPPEDLVEPADINFTMAFDVKP